MTKKNRSPATAKGFNAGRTPANAGKRYPAEILTQDEVVALMRGCSPRASTGLRNRAIIALLYRAGLRVSEALALLPKDVDVSAGTVRVLHGKGDRARTVGLDPGAMALVEQWLGRRRELGLAGQRSLFCTLAGRPVHPTYVRVLLRRLAEKAGIEKRVHPHGLRHTHAAELAAEGVPVNVIQKQLGHTSLAVTSRYLDHIAANDVVLAMQARVWSSQ